MSRTDDRADVTLPVTAEVGGEGGSFADPTLQMATFHQHEPNRGLPMEEGHQPAADTHAGSGMRRYPTEPPGPLPEARSWRGESLRAGLLGAAAGAAAGAAVALGLVKRRR